MDRQRDTRADLVLTMARLLRDQGYTATGRAQLLAQSSVSNGSLYHHFPGGMEQLAEAALEASGANAVAIDVDSEAGPIRGAVTLAGLRPGGQPPLRPWLRRRTSPP